MKDSGMKYYSMHFKHISLYFLLMVAMPLFLMSCGGKEVKPVSPEAKLAQEAFSLAETLKVAYAENDRSTLETNSTKDGFRELVGARKAFDRVDLTFTPTWVEIRDTSLYLTISWKGTWLVKGKVTEERGQAIFAFEGNPLKLAQVQRANPFKQPE
jgi:hypothetical protein